MRRLMHIRWFIQKKKSCIYGKYDFAWNQCSSALDLSEWWRVAKSWCVSPFWEKLKLSQYFAFFGYVLSQCIEILGAKLHPLESIFFSNKIFFFYILPHNPSNKFFWKGTLVISWWRIWIGNECEEAHMKIRPTMAVQVGKLHVRQVCRNLKCVIK